MKPEGAAPVVTVARKPGMVAGRGKGKVHVKDRVLSFALRAAGAGSAGVTFKEFARWLSP
jgi:hypothetical protein